MGVTAILKSTLASRYVTARSGKRYGRVVSTLTNEYLVRWDDGTVQHVRKDEVLPTK